MVKVSAAALSIAALLGAGCGVKRTNYGGPPRPVVAPPPISQPGMYSLLPTSAAVDLFRVTTDPIDEERPALAPDRSILLVGLRTYDAIESRFRYPGIVAVDPNGGPGRTFLTQPNTEAKHPAWLPDASAFVYVSNAPGAWTLVRASSRMAGASLVEVFPASMSPGADFPTVAPDGLVAFSVAIQQITMIATVRLDGAGYQLVEQGTEGAFSENGARIAFSRKVGQTSQIFVSDRSGAAVAQVTAGPAAAIWPAWSPDGQYLAFASNRGTEELEPGEQRYQLFVVRAKGGAWIQLTSGTSSCGFPSWGADGYVYFNSNQSGNYDIWRLRPALAAAG